MLETPPLTEASCPLAVFKLPPFTEAPKLVAAFRNPPLTEGSMFSYPESPDCGGIGVITGGLCADWIV